MCVRCIHSFFAQFAKINCVHRTVTNLNNVCNMTDSQFFVEYTLADIKIILGCSFLKFFCLFLLLSKSCILAFLFLQLALHNIIFKEFFNLFFFTFFIYRVFLDNHTRRSPFYRFCCLFCTWCNKRSTKSGRWFNVSVRS